jgi:hypothetical protein
MLGFYGKYVSVGGARGVKARTTIIWDVRCFLFHTFVWVQTPRFWTIKAQEKYHATVVTLNVLCYAIQEQPAKIRITVIMWAAVQTFVLYAEIESSKIFFAIKNVQYLTSGAVIRIFKCKANNKHEHFCNVCTYIAFVIIMKLIMWW